MINGSLTAWLPDSGFIGCPAPIAGCDNANERSKATRHHADAAGDLNRVAAGEMACRAEHSLAMRDGGVGRRHPLRMPSRLKHTER